MRHHLSKLLDVCKEEGILSAMEVALRRTPIVMNNLAFWALNGPGDPIMNEDWDNLVILDACRFDMFKKNVALPGKLERRQSMGSSSEEFMEQNFVGREFHDTVYVNSNPFIKKLGLDESTFHDVIDCLEEWDENARTVRPETVSEMAINAHEQYPNKRLIIHYMQPHTPFIGSSARNRRGGVWDDPNEEKKGLWEPLESGAAEIELDKVIDCYEENLNVVLAEVDRLLDEVDGKSVITSDHGNLLGERLWPIPTKRKFGHPYGVRKSELVIVPWFVLKHKDRRNIIDEMPASRNTESVELNDKLEALGYR